MMPEIQVRPIRETDIDQIVAIEHDYVTDYVWQMDIRQDAQNEIAVKFRQVRLPRSVKTEYPRPFAQIAQDWKTRSGVLVASLQDVLIGYIAFMEGIAPRTTWATDLAVRRSDRRQGVGSALVLAAFAWASQHGSHRMVLEMQSKNHPAICLAQKLGFDFCGYNDRYFMNRDIAMFYAKSVR
jgi:ribosomal protein S18 acetylase RimI-like enzyme